MQEIKKIKKISLANIAALLAAFFGFIAVFGAWIVFLVMALNRGGLNVPFWKFIFVNIASALFFALAAALAAAILGWIIGLLAALFYGFLAKEIGGIKIELEDRGTDGKPAETKKQELFKY